MKHSKAFSLVRHLPPRVRKAAVEHLKGHKRPQLFSLFAVLEKAADSEAEPEAEVVYKKVFSKKYDKAKDYLLRNEYRLLYEELRAVVFQHGIGHSDPLLLLGYWIDNGAYELFEDELNDIWRKAVAADDVERLVRLADLKIKYLLNHKTQSLPTAQELSVLSHQRIEWLKVIALREIRREEVRLKLAERLLQVYKQDFIPYKHAESINLDKLQQNDEYTLYLNKRADINAAKGDGKITLLQQILADTETIDKYEANAYEAKCRFLINLAQEYYLQGQHDNAVKYYNEAASYIKEVPKPVGEVLAYNYGLALLRAEKFDQAKQVADSFSSYILNSKVCGARGPFLFAVLNIYAYDADKAEEYIQLEAKKDGSEFYHFMRLALAMVYYLRGQVDLALRECINLDQAINYELNREATLQTHITKPIIATFKKFYSTINAKLPAVEYKSALQKLLNELQEVPTVQGDQSPDSVLKQWLMREVNRIIK